MLELQLLMPVDGMEAARSGTCDEGGRVTGSVPCESSLQKSPRVVHEVLEADRVIEARAC